MMGMGFKERVLSHPIVVLVTISVSTGVIVAGALIFIMEQRLQIQLERYKLEIARLEGQHQEELSRIQEETANPNLMSTPIAPPNLKPTVVAAVKATMTALPTPSPVLLYLDTRRLFKFSSLTNVPLQEWREVVDLERFGKELDTLMRAQPDRSTLVDPVPDLARTIRILPGGQSFIITLNEDARVFLADGTQFDAFVLQRILDDNRDHKDHERN